MPIKEKTVFIVDDHEMILPGLISVVESLEGFSVIGQAVDGEQGLKGILETKPDIAILDLSIPKLNGFEIIKKLHHFKNKTRVILLTSYSDDHYIEKALELEVDGYILKENASSELIKALENVAKGYKHMTPSIITKIINSLNKYNSIDKNNTILSNTLTLRENDVLKLVSQGMKGRAICKHLDICESTLKTHKSNIMKKLHLASTNEMIVYSMKHNIF